MKTKLLTQSIRIDARALRFAKSYADKEGWTLGQLIIFALERLMKEPEERWGKLVAADWLTKRDKIKQTSFNYDRKDQEFIVAVKKKKNIYSFGKLIEIALWHVPILKRKSGVLSADIILYQCTKCGHPPEVIDKADKGKERKCSKCRAKALPLNGSKSSYYNWKLEKFFRCLNLGINKEPDISGIDAKIVKRFFIKKMKQVSRAQKGQAWAEGDHVAVLYKGKIDKIGTKLVHVRFRKNDTDSFPEDGDKTKSGGIVLKKIKSVTRPQNSLSWSKGDRVAVSYEYQGEVYSIKKNRVFFKLDDGIKDSFPIDDDKTKNKGTVLRKIEK